MKILLDTHVFLWMNTARHALGRIGPYLLDPGSVLLLSAASSWEIAIKAGRGRLPLPERAGLYVPSRMSANGIEGLPVEQGHALAVADLPDHHRDPFDRLLVAQVQLEDLVLATGDPVFAAYGIPTLSP